MRLTDKVALVTGAAKGVGEGISACLAAAGTAVQLVDIDVQAGAQTLASLPGTHSFFEADIRDETQVAAAVRDTVTRFGGLDILVNNAGVNLSFDATRMTSQEWDDSMAIDFKGAWLVSKYALPEMVKRGGGVIINIASVHATMTAANAFPYAAAKAGLVGMTKSLALDWADKNVRVVAVSPGWILSDAVRREFARASDPAARESKVAQSIPSGFIGQPEDVGHLVAFLASDEARYITGTEIVIDGGISARFAE